MILAERFRGLGDQIPEAPVAVRPTPRATVTGRRMSGGKDDEDGEVETVTVPDLAW